jgi:uncharacterized protein with GYD domain
MATYILLTTLTDDGAETIKKNPDRIQEVNQEMQNMGVRVVAQYATLGPYDFINIVEAPDNETVFRLSAEMSSRGTVRILTLVALPVDEFIAGLKP